MTALEIYINHEKIATGGIPLGVISAIVHHLKLPTHKGQDGDSPERCSVSLGGLDEFAEEHLLWLRRDLEVGDEVRIRLVEADEVDTPSERKPKDNTRAAGR